MLRLTSVLGNSQRLDGGAMFGNAPRALWQTWLPPDAQGRVPLVCRALLVQEPERNILLETGIGSFFEPKYRERYGVVEPEHVLLKSLQGLGLSHEDIDVVVLSHLHFDHAGGLLAAHVSGEPPRLLFPRARFLVGRTAFDRAMRPHARDRASFIPQLPGLLEASGRLSVLDDQCDTSELLGERYRFWQSFGHTPGMLHTEVCGARARVVFCADLIPGLPWVHLPITMGYDRFPEQLIDEKASFYERVLASDLGLFFTHDPGVALALLDQDARGRMRPRHSFARLDRWDIDATPLPPS